MSDRRCDRCNGRGWYAAWDCNHVRLYWVMCFNCSRNANGAGADKPPDSELPDPKTFLHKACWMHENLPE